MSFRVTLRKQGNEFIQVWVASLPRIICLEPEMSASLPWKKQQTFLSICECIFHLTLGLFYPKVDWASDPKVDHKSRSIRERCFEPSSFSTSTFSAFATGTWQKPLLTLGDTWYLCSSSKECPQAVLQCLGCLKKKREELEMTSGTIKCSSTPKCSKGGEVEEEEEEATSDSSLAHPCSINKWSRHT